MKKLGLIVASLFIGAMVASAAQAISVPPLGDGYNSFYFTNNEVFKNNVGDAPNNIDVGDQFWGILDNQDIYNPTSSIGSGGGAIWRSENPTYSPPDEISGYFAIEVMGIYNVTNAAGADVTLILYGPTVDPNKILDQTNEVMRIFTDDPYTFTSTDRTAGVNSVTDGDHVWSLGYVYDEPFLTSPGDTLDATGYYYSFTPGHNNTDITAGEPGIVAYGGFNFLSGSPFTPLLNPICDPNDAVYNPACVGVIGTDNPLLVDIWFNAEIIIENTPDGVGALNDDPFDVFSNDPAVVNKYSAIPEPASMLLLGTGLVGLAGASRRKRKAAKK